jgi:hypothetical protein
MLPFAAANIGLWFDLQKMNPTSGQKKTPEGYRRFSPKSAISLTDKYPFPDKLFSSS